MGELMLVMAGSWLALFVLGVALGARLERQRAQYDVAFLAAREHGDAQRALDDAVVMLGPRRKG